LRYICSNVTTYSLFELNEHLRRVVALNFSAPVWVTAEIAQAQVTRGHTFLSLVQSDTTDTVQATAAAVLWQGDGRRLTAQHGTRLALALRSGQQVRLLVQVEYHERYGLRLQIRDVDTVFAEGQMALQRQQLLAHLRLSGLLERNRSLPLPLTLQRIAVISSDQAAGYQDFVQQLQENKARYRWQVVPFFSSVQGQYAPDELQAALLRVAQQADRFDAVVVVRGGGSRLDLAAFDHAEVCEAAARLPLPLLTGIGHDVDEAILDRVAHTALKTPTAVADFLIEHHRQFEAQLLQFRAECRQITQHWLAHVRRDLSNCQVALGYARTQYLQQAHQQLNMLRLQLRQAALQQLMQARYQLDTCHGLVTALHPDRALERGFVWVQQGGHPVTSVAQLNVELPLTLIWKDGERTVRVE
jgi:exodeoxyribonuclease VII large subunit